MEYQQPTQRSPISVSCLNATAIQFMKAQDYQQAQVCLLQAIDVLEEIQHEKEERVDHEQDYCHEDSHYNNNNKYHKVRLEYSDLLVPDNHENVYGIQMYHKALCLTASPVSNTVTVSLHPQDKTLHEYLERHHTLLFSTVLFFNLGLCHHLHALQQGQNRAGAWFLRQALEAYETTTGLTSMLLVESHETEHDCCMEQPQEQQECFTTARLHLEMATLNNCAHLYSCCNDSPLCRGRVVTCLNQVLECVQIAYCEGVLNDTLHFFAANVRLYSFYSSLSLSGGAHAAAAA